MRQVPNIAGVVLILFFAAFPLVYTGGNYDYAMHVLITAFFYAILASSWSMLAGYAGQFSFGHMAQSSSRSGLFELITTACTRNR